MAISQPAELVLEMARIQPALLGHLTPNQDLIEKHSLTHSKVDKCSVTGLGARLDFSRDNRIDFHQTLAILVLLMRQCTNHVAIIQGSPARGNNLPR